MKTINNLADSLLHLIFPHLCIGCGSDVLDKGSLLCLDCLSSLPQTSFHLYPNNPVEKIFWGRVALASATAHYYFSKDSVMQRLMHQLKYKGNKEAGVYLGRLMGTQLAASNRFAHVDALVPLPLHPKKEHKRGYNQAAVLCEGIAQILKKPVLKTAVVRTQHTESQTRKNRVERWQNMEGRFEVRNAKALEGKHVLLVDDVVTTGATLEACAQEIVQVPHTRLSIAALCFAHS